MEHISGESPVTRGPIVIDHDGSILSGHDRHRELKQAYSTAEDAANYKRSLVNHSLKFRVDPLQIARMKQPVLVRKITSSDLPHNGGDAATK